MPYTPAEFDMLPATEARATLLDCCASTSWVEGLVGGRPYRTRAALLRAADDASAALTGDDLDEALAAHPRIGERSEHISSQREQAAVAAADPRILDALAAGNRLYEARFGHVYLVRAAGRSAAQLLSILQQRLADDSATELFETRSALAEINRARLGVLVVDEPAQPVDTGEEGLR